MLAIIFSDRNARKCSFHRVLIAIEVQLALKQMGLSQYSIYACFSQGI